MNSQVQPEYLMIPQSLLLPSKKANVRKNKSSGMSIAQLAENIFHVGVLQNLVVTRDADGVHFNVVAGGRRLKALKLLVTQKRRDKDAPVLCQIVAEEAATAASLSENIEREAMHPADEFEAFAKLIEEGKTIDDVAAQFGVTPLVVRQRLKLANVSPRLIAQYRAGELNLAQMMALAIVDDHKAQEAAIKNSPEWQRSPEALRDHLTAKELDARTDRVAKFVGVTVYEASGGVIRRDLFAEDAQDGYIVDVPLLEELARNKLEPMAVDARAQGWAWVDVVPRADSSELAGFQRAQRVRREPNAKEAKRLAEIEAEAGPLYERIAELEGIEDEAEQEATQEEYDRLEKQREKLERKQEALREKLMTFPADVMALAGAIVTIDYHGNPITHSGLLKNEDALALHHRARIATAKQAGLAQDDAEPEQKAGISEALARKLSSHRTAALQIELARQPQIALVALVHQLAQQLLYDAYHTESVVHINAVEQNRLAHHAPDIDAAPAALALAELRITWQRRLPEDIHSLFATLLTFSQDDLLALLAVCVGCTLSAITDSEDAPRAQELARTLKLDMRHWWTANASSYFAQVSKAKIIEAVGEFKPKQTAHLGTLKKGVLVTEAERLAVDTGWLPALLKTM